MKILHIIDSEGLYGAEKVLINLSEEQKKAGHNPIIINMRPCNVTKPSIQSEAFQNGVKYKVISLKVGLDIIGAFKIVKYAANHHFDIIHSHGYKPNILLGLMPKIIRKRPIIATLHGWTSTENLSKIWVFEQLDLISLKFMDAVVVVSRAMKAHPRLKKSKLKLQVVNNGIPEINFDNFQLDKNILAFCGKGFVIGGIGRLSKEKAFEYLIGALYQLCQKGIDARLVIFGDGPERKQLESNIHDMKLQDKVLMPGYMDSAKQYLPYFNALVIPSVTEGLPITLLEAMQSRVPIVATGVGGIPEVLDNGRAGLLIQSCNPGAIADAISRVYRDEKFTNEISNIAYHRVTTNYSSKTMAKEYLDIYIKIINNWKLCRLNNLN